MSYNPAQLISVIGRNRDRSLAVSKIVGASPNHLSVVPKLIRDKNVNNVEEDRIMVNRNLLEQLHHKVETNRQNNKNIIKLFPDIELAIQILVAYILSPKKMTDTQLNYKFKKEFEATPSLTSAILETVRSYIEEEHELEDRLAEIVREALFNSGSYCLAVIPEAAVDEVINADILASYSTEDFKVAANRLISQLVEPKYLPKRSKEPLKPLSEKATAMELVQHMVNVTLENLTDNLGVLQFDAYKQELTNTMVRRAERRGGMVATESMDRLGYMDLFRDRASTGSNASNVHILKDRDETRRKSIGKPMTVRFPSGSVIPVCVPGNEREHIAYLVLLDGDGKPFNIELSESRTNNTNLLHNQNGITPQSPIQIAYRNLINDNSNNIDVSQLYDMYRDVLERQLFSSIRGTLYGSNFEIAAKNDIFFMMFSRALADEKTNVLFVPKTQMTYFAFNYNEFGIGSSLLDNLTTLSSLRAMLLFSSVMAQTKSAIDVTRVNVQLDPNDQDPEKTITQIQDATLKLRQNFFPLGINNPVDLVDWIRRSGLQFNYSGNPLLPDIKIDFENGNTGHTIPDGALEESLRKQTIQALGLSPEVIDTGFTPEFATSVINNNVLLAKRVAIYQKTLAKLVSKFIGQVVYYDQDLRKKIKQTLLEMKEDFGASLPEDKRAQFTANSEEFLEDYIDQISASVQAELPKPENTNLASLAIEFDQYKQGLTTVVDSVISTEIFTEDTSGMITNHIDSIKSVYTHHLLREWCANNNYYPEVMELFSASQEEVDTLIEVITKHMSSTMRSSSKLLSVMKKYKEATAVDLKRILGGEAGDNSFTADSGSNGGDEAPENSSNSSDPLAGLDDLDGMDLTKL